MAITGGNWQGSLGEDPQALAVLGGLLRAFSASDKRIFDRLAGLFQKEGPDGGGFKRRLGWVKVHRLKAYRAFNFILVCSGVSITE